jgi:3-oxoadipate enol-lactonase
VCQSMGGWTGLPFTLQHPDRVACLVLCDTPGGLHTERIGQSLAKTGDRIREAGIDANAALAPDFPQRCPEMAHLYAQISGLNTAVEPTALSALAAPEARIAPESLAAYTTPTLVLAGEHDLLFPAEMMAHVAELIPGAVLLDFPACGHSTYFEDPATFNERVGAFVRQHA